FFRAKARVTCRFSRQVLAICPIPDAVKNVYSLLEPELIIPVQFQTMEDNMESVSETKTALQSLSHGMSSVIERTDSGVLAVTAHGHLSASGVCWRDDVIVTAAHTVRQTESISVIVSSGETVVGTLAGTDPSTDLAVLKINSAKLTAPPFGDTSQLKVGDVVLAVGRGARRGLNATMGIVGVLSGAWRTW